MQTKMYIKATIIQDSINSNGTRITTFELEYPRIIHSELMTHRMFSRNAASSRAIPISKVIELVRDDFASPVHWGKNQPGMQAKEELEGHLKLQAQQIWCTAARAAANYSEQLSDLGAHKQVANRVTEPYQWMKTVVTATNYENWFWLRNHPDADPTIEVLASAMWTAFSESVPMPLKPGEWHVPYVERVTGRFDDKVHYFIPGTMQELSIEDALMVSASCAAQTSFRNSDDSLEKARAIFKRLIESEPVHASPVEHAALCFDPSYYWPTGVTHRDRDGVYYSGNFKDWIQYRQLIPNNAKGSWKSCA